MSFDGFIFVVESIVQPTLSTVSDGNFCLCAFKETHPIGKAIHLAVCQLLIEVVPACGELAAKMTNKKRRIAKDRTVNWKWMMMRISVNWTTKILAVRAASFGDSAVDERSADSSQSSEQAGTSGPDVEDNDRYPDMSLSDVHLHLHTMNAKPCDCPPTKLANSFEFNEFHKRREARTIQDFWLEVREIPGVGKGVFAKIDIAMGQSSMTFEALCCPSTRLTECLDS
ncbi:hypothetical protein Aduo_006985 [Ancylostoma duodenale]